MRFSKKYLKKHESGITLIALIVTIIILLILAGVAISNLTGSNGLIKKTEISKEKTEISIEEEGINIAVTTSRIKDTGYSDLNKNDLQNAIDDQFGNGKVTVIDNNNGTYDLIMNNGSSRSYTISNDGTISTEPSNIWNGSNSSEGLYGIGTDSQPFLIQNSADLAYLRNIVNNNTKIHSLTNSDFDQFDNSTTNYQMTTDLDLNVPDSNWKNWDANTTGLNNWVSIGTYESTTSHTSFKGIFDGNNKKIAYLYIKCATRCGGLFSNVDGTIKNLTISSGFVQGYGGIGAIVGWACGTDSKIINCVNNANVCATDSTIGGVAGSIAGLLSECKNIGTITCTIGTDMGGVTGYLESTAKIEKCINYGLVKGLNGVGGITGPIIENSQIQYCVNLGNVSGTDYVGGISATTRDTSKISNCYNVGIVNGLTRIGGISGLGWEQSNITNCYNVGKINGNSYVGGIIGNIYSSSNSSNCYFLNTSCSYSTGGISKTDSEMKSQNLLELLGTGNWKFVSNKNNGYPVLIFE